MVRLLILLTFTLSLSFGIEILSDSLYTDAEGNVVAEGDVLVDYRDLTMRADRLKYVPGTRDVFAYGKVFIRRKDGSFEVAGREAYLNLDTERGYFLDAQGRFREFYFSARRVEKVGDRDYVVEGGEITTCPPDRKEMRLCFWKANVSDRYVVSFSNSLRFFRLPVAYSPFLVFPVGERRSGLLPPFIGQNSYNSFIYIQPFYWAISEDRDATFTVDYRDKQAKGLWVEYRQAFTDRERLYTRISYYRERTPPGKWWEGRYPESFRENRFRLEFDLGFKGWRIGLDLPSDPYFFEDFYFSKMERTIPFTLSYLTYTRLERDYLLSLNLRSYYDLTSAGNERTLSLLPELGFYSRPEKVGPLFVSLTSTFSNFYSEKAERIRRLLFLPQVELPLKVSGLRSYTSLTFINNFYFTEGSSGDERVTSLRLENRLPLFKDFSFHGLNLSNTLELVYAFSPENFNNPQIDTFDRVTKENNLKLRLSSALLNGEKTIGNLFLEGGYNLLRSYRFPTDSSLVEKNLLPFRAILSLYPSGWLTLSEDATYDANLGVLAKSVSSASLSYRGGKLTLSYVASKNSEGKRLTDQYTLGGELDVKGVLAGGSTTFDNLKGKELYRRLYAGYRGACWTFSVDYRRTYYGAEKGYLKEIFLILTVFNLSDIKLPLRRR